MPIVPLYQQRTEASGQISAGADASSFGAQTAQAGARIGSALQDLGSANALTLRLQEERDAKAWSGDSVSKATLQWMTTMRERQASAKAGAPNFAPELIADFDKYAGETINNAPTPLAKQYLKQHMEALRTGLGEQAMNFEAQARIRNRDDLGAQSIDTWAKVVQQDPGAFGKAMAALRETLPNGAIEGDKLTQHAKATLTEAAASQVLDADPYKLQDYTSKALGHKDFKGPTGVPWVDEATPEQVKMWNNHASTKIHMLEAEQKRELEVRERKAKQAFNSATDLSFKGQYLSPTFADELRTLTEGTEFEAATTELIDSQKTTAGFASAPASTRTQVLNEWQRRGSTPGTGTNPDAAKQLERVTNIDSEIKKAVKDNPWLAAQRYGVTTDAAVLPINAPQDAIGLIGKRAQQQTTIETWAGQPISPLQPIEAAALVKSMETMPPPVKAQALGTLGSMLTLPRLEALADQLDQHDKPLALAMKLGADPTSAGRVLGELVLRGAQALKDKTVKRDDTALAGWRAEIANMVRGTLGDQKAEDDAIDAAYYVRASMDADSTPVPGFRLKASNEEAVRFIVGQPVTRQGVKTLLPRGMSESDFDKKLQVYTPQRLNEIAGGTVWVRGQPLATDKLARSLDRMGLRRDGSGNYIPVSGGALVTRDRDGNIPLRLPVQ